MTLSASAAQLIGAQTALAVCVCVCVGEGGGESVRREGVGEEGECGRGGGRVWERRREGVGEEEGECVRHGEEHGTHYCTSLSFSFSSASEIRSA